VAFYTEIMRCVPSIDEEDIKEHNARHDKYVDLCEEKKKLVI
jgi:hypothetical protein